MRINIKEGSREKNLIDKAVEYFGYKTPTQFILTAIISQYYIEVNKQLVIAAKNSSESLDINTNDEE